MLLFVKVGIIFFVLIAYCFERFLKVNLLGSEQKNVDDVAFSIIKKSNSAASGSSTVVFQLSSVDPFYLYDKKQIQNVLDIYKIETLFQTGDQTFDEKIFVATDSENIRQALREDESLRALVLDLFKLEVFYVEKNNHSLDIHSTLTTPDVETENKSVILFRSIQQLKTAKQSAPGSLKKYLFLDKLTNMGIWSMGLITAASIYFVPEDIHFLPILVIFFGLIFGGFIFLAKRLLIKKLFRNSSLQLVLFKKIHNFLFMSLMILSGIGLFSFINRYFDYSESAVITARITKAYAGKRTKSGFTIRRGFWQLNNRTIHVDVLKNPSQESLPIKIKLSRADYSKVGAVGNKIRIHVGKGLFGLRWYKSFDLEQDNL